MGHGYGLDHARVDGSEADYPDPWDVMSTMAWPYLVEFRVPELWDAAIPHACVLVHRFASNHSYLMANADGVQALTEGQQLNVGDPHLRTGRGPRGPPRTRSLLLHRASVGLQFETRARSCLACRIGSRTATGGRGRGRAGARRRRPRSAPRRTLVRSGPWPTTGSPTRCARRATRARSSAGGGRSRPPSASSPAASATTPPRSSSRTRRRSPWRARRST